MSFKQVTVVSAIVAALSAGLGARSSSAQTTPVPPRPASPQPADPAKPVGPPQGKEPSVRIPQIRVGAPSAGAANDAPAKEEGGSTDAADFLKDAGHDGMVEVELAKLAQTKASRQDVRMYAIMLETDHRKANDELIAISRRKNVTPPKEWTPAEKMTRTRLEAVSGAAFDDEYMSTMVDDHTKAVSAFTAATRNADLDVKAFAEKTLPTLKHHLEEAQKLSGKK